MHPTLVTPLELAVVLAALLVAGGALCVAWRSLKTQDRLRVKLDWLRSTSADLQAQLRSYDSVTPADRKRTTLMPAHTAGKLQVRAKP